MFLVIHLFTKTFKQKQVNVKQKYVQIYIEREQSMSFTGYFLTTVCNEKQYTIIFKSIQS